MTKRVKYPVSIFQRKSVFLILILFLGCKTVTQHKDFKYWFESTFDNYPVSSDLAAGTHVFSFQSAPLDIDTIYRSMQGPYDVMEFIPDSDDEKLIWLTGYRANIVDPKTKKEISPGFMCHNNLDISNVQTFPWKVKTQGTSIRLFTLSEGQTAVKFPDGFGLPIATGQSLSMFAQVLNHNIADLNVRVMHSVTLEYAKQSELKHKLRPLYSQVVFITKKQSERASSETNTGVPHCGINSDGASYNPYIDDSGNIYTGHWQIPVGKEILHTNVTRMLDLSFDTQIHFIGVHLHPFAKRLILKDLTTDSILYTATATNYENKIGIANMPYYSSTEGIPVYKSHAYELISEYQNTDSINVQTAMATMLLYLEDK